MARKGVFQRTMEAAKTAETPSRTRSEGSDNTSGEPEAAKRTAPNVRYFGASFEEQMRRTAQDLDPNEIRMSTFEDRLDVADGLEDLIASIRESGQQVPILVRKLPDTGQLEVVYGRRRILACRQLDRPVRGMVVTMSDEDALVAQGLENAARLDTSYIERARFAGQLAQAEYSQAAIADALGVDVHATSRMLKVISTVPEGLIRTIGPAHGAGRRRWLHLADLLNAADAPEIDAIMDAIPQEKEGAERLTAAIRHLEAKVADRRDNTSGERGSRQSFQNDRAQRHLADDRLSIRRQGRKLTLTARTGDIQGFLDHLDSRIERLYQDWRDGSNPDETTEHEEI